MLPEFLTRCETKKRSYNLHSKTHSKIVIEFTYFFVIYQMHYQNSAAQFNLITDDSTLYNYGTSKSSGQHFQFPIASLKCFL